jgi:asparagine synthase (glutamine-hydrolysing)
MCGIFSVYKKNGITKNELNEYINNGKLLSHRGTHVTYRLINNKLLLYHNRLSINDLSNNATQPIIKNNIMIIVNGEIYNYKELYDEVKEHFPSYNFKSKSDSEILIPLYLLHGSSFINKLRGMYSFLLYDASKNILIIVRDHIGITSLYYILEKDNNDSINTLMISSEMKTLTSLSKNINVFEPGTVYINGTFFTHYSPKWKEANYIPNGELNYDEIKQKLINSVLKHTLSDQPIGILLSGGLDSSLIASIMVYLKKNNLISNPIKTYTIGLENASDIIEAEKVSKFLNSDHTTYNFSTSDAIDVLEDVIYYLETYDITTIRASIPLYLLSMQIVDDTDIKVLLSGEVSDEIFAGYLYFHKAPNKEELQQELVDKVSLLNRYDCLRAHKATMAHTLELRVPFADRDFIDYIMNIDPKYKMINKKINENSEQYIEKYILRKAFDNGEFLPHDILWRVKEQFSDGVSSKTENVIDTLKKHAEDNISDDEFNKKETIFPINTPLTKEAFLYRKIFEKFYPHECCIKTVNENSKSIACSTERAFKWLDIDEKNKINDPSGHVMLYLI